VLCFGAAQAADLRLALWNADLSREGPGILLRDLSGGKDAQSNAVIEGLLALDADVVVLLGMDHDHDLLALGALADRLAGRGAVYPHRFALRPNTGMATGLDLDGDGRLGEPEDNQGFGRFAGTGGMAVLSRLPIDTDAARDFSPFLWRDLPGALLPETMTPEVQAVQRLSTTGHWDVPVLLPDGGRLHLLIWHATPPAFDGPEDRNGRRNHDEAAFWLRLLEGQLPFPPPEPPFVLIGQATLDPMDGDGRPEALQELLSHPALQDPRPAQPRAETDPSHRGDPALDTAFYGGKLGALRVDYILPAAGLTVRRADILRPDPDSAEGALLQKASRHAPIWVDLTLR
jgi:hypothetical protein